MTFKKKHNTFVRTNGKLLRNGEKCTIFMKYMLNNIIQFQCFEYPDLFLLLPQLRNFLFLSCLLEIFGN